MFQHIIRCEVIGADPVHQSEWFAETMAYMAERWHELGPKELTELRTLGERFAKPARSSAPAEPPRVDDAPAGAPIGDDPVEVVAGEPMASESDERSLDPVSA